MKTPRERHGHEGLEPEVAATMRQIGNIIGQVTPPGYGFALLMFGTGDSPGRMNYICNCHRDDMVAALKELVANFEGRIAHDAPTGPQ